MAKKKEYEGYPQLHDLTMKQKVAKSHLAQARFIPRAGDRIFISLIPPGDRES